MTTDLAWSVKVERERECENRERKHSGKVEVWNGHPESDRWNQLVEITLSFRDSPPN